jgi:predicted NBD/HSP70 family sugar kinase
MPSLSMVDPALLRGSAGFAGEFGQIVLGGDSAPAGRSKPGHLESYIGKDAILGFYRTRGGEADLDRLLQGLARREEAATATARVWGERLAAGLIQVTSVLNPGLIILGGSVAAVFPHVATEVSKAMQRELLEGFPLPRIEVSGLGVEGPALGGALLMHQRMFSIDESAIYASEQPITLFQS